MLRSVYLEFPRPQYVSVPEGFLTALAGATSKVDYGIETHGLALAVAYESKAARFGTQSSTLFFHATKPTGEHSLAFASALKQAGIEGVNDQLALANAVAAGIAGVRAKDGRVRATIPLTVSLALAQNLRGLVGSRNPPDVAGILEQFFQMGAPERSDGEPGAAERWVGAVNRRREVDKVINAIDAAASQQFLKSVEPKGDPPLLKSTTNDFQDTPYSWFYKTWTSLCSAKWVEALPARVWVDWANTVLRLSFGLGYLWEVAWYEVVSRSVIGGGSDSPEDLMRQVGPLITWKDSKAAISLRDVASSTKWRVMRSNGIREQIWKWHETHEGFENASEQLSAMRTDSALKTALTDALANPSGSNANLWEAINYSLLTREGVGPDADHYGFLRKNGPRYSVPDPGVQWLAAISSMACPGPGTSTNVGELLRSLRELGLRPELGDLVNRLEQAGVAQGSPDADQAVEIQAAF